MDISTIPKTFWHALSLSVLIATAGLVYIAYKSSSVSIEIANAKIQLSSALTETRDIKSDLEQENERLKSAETELKNRLAMLEELLNEGASPPEAAATLRRLKPLASETETLEVRPISQERFKAFDSRIEQAQQYLK